MHFWMNHESYEGSNHCRKNLHNRHNNKLEINIEKLVCRQFVLSFNFVSKALYFILALNNFCKKSLGKMFEYDFV